MTSPVAPLPSVSSVLQWARGHAEEQTEKSASNKRTFAGVDEDIIPAPLTNDIIEQAIEELPQGACVALESCLTALKVDLLLAPVIFLMFACRMRNSCFVYLTVCFMCPSFWCVHLWLFHWHLLYKFFRKTISATAIVYSVYSNQQFCVCVRDGLVLQS
jgi:hypothetical protein